MKKEILISIIVGFLFAGVLTFGASAGGKFNVPNYFKKSGSAITPYISTDELGSNANRIAKIWATDFDTTNITIGGVSSGNIDMNNNLILNIGASGTDFTSGGGLNVTATTTLSGNLLLKDNQYLYFDTAKTDWLKYSSSHTGLVLKTDYLTTEGGFNIYSNTGADANGNWEPYLDLNSNGIVTLGNTSQGENKLFDVVFTDGMRLKTTNGYAQMKTDNVVSNKIFQFPNLAGTFLMATGTQAISTSGTLDVTATTTLSADVGIGDGNRFYFDNNLTASFGSMFKLKGSATDADVQISFCATSTDLGLPGSPAGDAPFAILYDASDGWGFGAGSGVLTVKESSTEKMIMGAANDGLAMGVDGTNGRILIGNHAWDGLYAYLQTTNLDADRTYEFPNNAGTFITSGNPSDISIGDLGGFGTATTTAGSIIVADGTDYEGVIMSGDATMSTDGTLTISHTSVKNVCPRPVYNTRLETTYAFTASTTGHLYQFELPFKITFSQLDFRVNTIGAAGALKIGIYSEDGQTLEASTTTESFSGTGTKSNAFSASTLEPGIHWLMIVPVDTANITLNAWNDSAYSTGIDSSGKIKINGKITVTASTLPATFDPTTLSSANPMGLYMRLSE